MNEVEEIAIAADAIAADNMKKLLVTTGKRLTRLSPELSHPFCRMVSRIHYKPDYLRHRLSSEFIPDLLKMNRRAPSWREACLSRAREIFDTHSGPLYLAWSGGIDSTTMAASLLEVATPEERSRLTIVLSHHSVLENPSYFENHLLKFPKVNILCDISNMLIEKKTVLITGELGDQLFGSDFLIDADFSKPYQDSVPQMLGPVAFERLHPIVTEAPFPIRTTHDFFWWFNFSQKWQFVKYRAYEHTTWNMQARYGNSFSHFFDSVDFQLWSLQNHDLKHGGDWASYKSAAKDFLVELTRDEAQRHLKKWQSLEKTYLVSENRLAVDEDQNPIGTFEELEPYVLN